MVKVWWSACFSYKKYTIMQIWSFSNALMSFKLDWSIHMQILQIFCICKTFFWKVLSDVRLYLEMGDNRVFIKYFWSIWARRVFEILFKMSIYQISQLVWIYKKCEAKKGVNVAKYSPITFC